MHAYDKDGNPVHQVINASKSKGGKKVYRPTTKRDMKKLDLAPSVTEIMKIKAQGFMLQNYIVEQAINAALSTPPEKGESDKDHMKRIKEVSQEHRKETAKRGNEIHQAINEFIQTGTVYKDYAQEIVATMAEVKKIVSLNDCESEVSFYEEFESTPYGGTIDLASKKNQVIIDFKTRDFGDKDPADIKPYSETAMQLAAYAFGYTNFSITDYDCYAVMIARDKPGLVSVYKYSKDEITDGIDSFECLTNYWYINEAPK